MNLPYFVTSMEHWTSKRQKTAIHRKKLSAPFQKLISHDIAKSLLLPNISILDYACGFGDDVKSLQNMGFQTVGYDAYHCSNTSFLIPRKYEVVSCLFCINVIEDEREREELINWLWTYFKPELLLLSIRNSVSRKGLKEVRTTIGTYQQAFTAKEFRQLVVASLPDEDYILTSAGSEILFVSTKKYKDKPLFAT